MVAQESVQCEQELWLSCLVIWREYLGKLLERGHLLACCAVNLTEVHAGMRESEKAKAEQFLDSLEFFPIGPEVAKLAGSLSREWRQLGHTLSYTDLNIAAVGIHHDIALLTSNQKHFPMPALSLYPLPASAA
jgi:predicted nucleic acid-binding protein